jgi:apolipoprotein N-acyltransferase
MSLESLKYDPDCIVWSETAFVPSVSWNTTYKISSSRQRLCEEFVEFGKSLSIPLISGNVDAEMDVEGMGIYRPDGEYNWKTYNAVMLFGDGRLLDTYRKQHLVPFTEYFPYEAEFPHLYAFLKANDYKWWEMGNDAKVLNYGGLNFATPICFEDMFGYLSAEFVQNGADLLINLTNDSWSGSVPAELQHLQLASFRAIENRRPLLRSTNSGITCLVDVTGRIINQLEPFTMTYGIYDVETGKEAGLTFYTRHPDFFGRLFALLGVLVYPFGAAHYLKAKRREEAEALSALFAELPDCFEV